MNVPKVLIPVTQKAGQIALKTQKYAPQILVGLGITGYGAALVKGCSASTKLPALMDDFYKECAIRNEHGLPPDKKKLLKELGRLYGPTAVIFAVSTGLVLKGYGIINDRYLSAVADAAAWKEGFLMYREAVKKDLGEEKDLEYRYGIKKQKDIQENPDGTMDVVHEETYRPVVNRSPAMYSIYARCFDESNWHWDKDPQQNLIFLNHAQSYLNNILQARGHLFLNEVYRELGFEETKAGAIVGWLVAKGNDNYVDFGIYNVRNDRANDFVNGYERSVWLDFNVDGIIFDKI